MVFGGVAIGVRKQAEADIQMPIMSGRGEMPPPTAMGRASGAIRAAVAVLDMKLVMTAVSAQQTSMSSQGSLTVLPLKNGQKAVIHLEPLRQTLVQHLALTRIEGDVVAQVPGHEPVEL